MQHSTRTRLACVAMAVLVMARLGKGDANDLFEDPQEQCNQLVENAGQNYDNKGVVAFYCTKLVFDVEKKGLDRGCEDLRADQANRDDFPHDFFDYFNAVDLVYDHLCPSQ
ncbi:uncharacterized protein LOC143285727 [Babylonia areolata]|uniref:uncharacterized protein LOC143285727 n=1 Tax=Babylonia areolata TaxID=304850 RepID=UPI003FD4EAC3